ncbi:cob(I)yrinic acid a,c-diamide adenosyltransferase [Namhaeicola litoreus]|uniref:Corrinoid adenosyltransferase n=1 Tax=Namhaeicola litoreus TaxID=1052145 RepID=A0ABW3Y3Q3_9FLAO
MKIYTKTGDTGDTSLFGGERVKKYNPRLEAYGTIDELNCHVGLISVQKIPSNLKDELNQIQNLLFTIGAMLATPPSKEKLKSGKDRLQIEKLSEKDVLSLEDSIDRMNEFLPGMTHFILPGGNTTVSFCHIARTVCRRAERMIVKLADEEPVLPIIITYINRLSDYLFVLARKLTFDQKAEEVKWISR